MRAHWEVVNAGGIVVSNSPQELWDNACKYFKWSDENPMEVKRTLRSGREAGKIVIEKHVRPYSIKGLCLHCGILEEYLKDIRMSKDKTSLYFVVVSKILYIIYIQNYEHATVGVFNPIFVAKALNMDKEDNSQQGAIKVEIVHGLPELASSENDILEALEREGKGYEKPLEEFIKPKSKEDEDTEDE